MPTLDEAISQVSKTMIANDKSILDVIRALTEKVILMETRITTLENRVTALHQIVLLLDQDVHTSSASRDARDDYERNRD